MIKKLQKKLIIFSGLATLIFISIIFAIYCVATATQLNNTMDSITSSILSNNGQLPKDVSLDNDYFTEEAKDGFRYFIVKYDNTGDIMVINIDKVSTVDTDEAKEFANTVLTLISKKNKYVGWFNDFRYRISTSPFDTTIVFVDGSMNKKLTTKANFAALFTIFGGGAIVFGLLVLLSKRLVYPIAESYEKQKQFITDINHEIKTPLTLIKTNVDIVESEVGSNEWLDDIKKETETMTELVNELVTLTKMDEKKTVVNKEIVNLSEVLTETFNEFKAIADSKNKEMVNYIESNINFECDKSLVNKVVGILLDNAIKYCDDNGTIVVHAHKKKHVTIQVENTYKDIDKLELNNLFDRFYRADKSRTAKGSFGIGLSIAKSTCELIDADIKCSSKNHDTIIFTLTLK